MFRRLVLSLLVSLLLSVAPAVAMAGDDVPVIAAERVAALDIDLQLTAVVQGHERMVLPFEIRVDGRMLSYAGPVGAPRNNRFERRTVELELDDMQLAHLVEILDEHAVLLTDFTESQPPRDKGESITAVLSASDLGRSVTVNVSGTLEGLAASGGGDDDVSPLLSPDAARRARALVAFCASVKTLVEGEVDLFESP